MIFCNLYWHYFNWPTITKFYLPPSFCFWRWFFVQPSLFACSSSSTNSKWAVTRPPHWTAAPKATCSSASWADPSPEAPGAAPPPVRPPTTAKPPRSPSPSSCSDHRNCPSSLSCDFALSPGGKRWWGSGHLQRPWKEARWPQVPTVRGSSRSATRSLVGCSRRIIRGCIRGMFRVTGVWGKR